MRSLSHTTTSPVVPPQMNTVWLSFGLTTRVTPCASHHLKAHMGGTLGLWYRSILQVRMQAASRRPLNTSHDLQRCSMRLRSHNEDLHASNAALVSPPQGIRQKRIHARSKWPLNASHDFQRCSTRPQSNNEDLHASSTALISLAWTNCWAARSI